MLGMPMPLVLYTVAEARLFLQERFRVVMTHQALSRHCKIGTLRSTLLGREYLILEEDLVRFAAIPHPRGRPPKS
jgi:hypothetical protein